jgi:hypothetical protein
MVSCEDSGILGRFPIGRVIELRKVFAIVGMTRHLQRNSCPVLALHMREGQPDDGRRIALDPYEEFVMTNNNGFSP